MLNIWRTVIKYRRITLFMVAMVAIAGMYGYSVMPRNEMPDGGMAIAVLTVVYPGAAPADIDRLVVQPIEDEVAEIEKYSYSAAYIYNSYAIVQVRMEYDLDVDKTWDELRRRLTDLQATLPSGCCQIDVNTEITETAGIILALTGNDYSYEELNSFAESLGRQLGKVEGLTRFDIEGKQDKEVIINVDYRLLNQYNLSLNDIVQLIKGQNIEIPSGTINSDEGKINVKTDGNFIDMEDISNLVIGVSMDNGVILRLRDIATVEMITADDMYRIKHNGENAVLLTGFFEKNTNVVQTGQEVDKIVDQFMADLPAGLNIHKVLDQPADVKKSVNSFAMNLLQGVIFVIIVVFFGMGLRNAIIVSTAIPLSIFTTFGMMVLFGVELHTISIAALIIALGMLVDNAIVVSDAIQLCLDDGQERLDACINGVKEVAIPVLTSTLTTIAAFTPFLWMQSVAAEFVISLPIIIIIALSASYLVALFVTPTMAYIFFKPGGQQFDRFTKIRLYFDKMLQRAMEKKRAMIMIVLVMIAGTAVLAMNIPLQFFPYADKDMMFIDIAAEKNIDITTTMLVTNQIEEILQNHPEVTQYTTSLGGGLPKFYTTVFNFKRTANTAQILMKLDFSKSDRFKDEEALAASLQQELDENVIGGKAIVKRLELAEYIGHPIKVRLTGDNLADLEEVAVTIKDKLYQIDGCTNIEDDFPERLYEYNVIVDNNKAAYMGLTKYDVQNEVSIALSGRAASVLHYRGEDFTINVQSDIKSIEELENLRIKSSFTGMKTLLKNVADVQLAAVLPGLNRYDRDYTIMVSSDLLAGYQPRDIMAALDEQMRDMNTMGVQVGYEGEQEKINENFGEMGAQAVTALVLVYLILLFQFRSFRQPLVILLTIPLSAIGSICGLFILGQPLSFTALMGMISLMGIVVNNAIVLIDYINRTRAEGEGVVEACMKATDKRFRPIILSTTTTFIGMIPLLFSGSDLFGPMAISLMFGLLISTVLTLVVIPVVYSIAEQPRIRAPKNLIE